MAEPEVARPVGNPGTQEVAKQLTRSALNEAIGESARLKSGLRFAVTQMLVGFSVLVVAAIVLVVRFRVNGIPVTSFESIGSVLTAIGATGAIMLILGQHTVFRTLRTMGFDVRDAPSALSEVVRWWATRGPGP